MGELLVKWQNLLLATLWPYAMTRWRRCRTLLRKFIEWGDRKLEDKNHIKVCRHKIHCARYVIKPQELFYRHILGNRILKFCYWDWPPLASSVYFWYSSLLFFHQSPPLIQYCCLHHELMCSTSWRHLMSLLVPLDIRRWPYWRKDFEWPDYTYEWNLVLFLWLEESIIREWDMRQQHSHMLFRQRIPGDMLHTPNTKTLKWKNWSTF